MSCAGARMFGCLRRATSPRRESDRVPNERSHMEGRPRTDMAHTMFTDPRVGVTATELARHRIRPKVGGARERALCAGGIWECLARASIAFHIGRLSLFTSSHGPGSCYFCDMPSSIPSTLPCAPRATATPGQDTKRGRCEGRARGSSKIHPLEALPYIDRLQTRGGVRSITDRLRRPALSPRKHPPRVLDSPSPARSPTATAASCATSSDFSAHSIT